MPPRLRKISKAAPAKPVPSLWEMTARAPEPTREQAAAAAAGTLATLTRNGTDPVVGFAPGAGVRPSEALLARWAEQEAGR
jgi:hypothetical protein